MRSHRLIPICLFAPITGCSGVQSVLNPAADQAAQSDIVWKAMLVVCGVMYLLVMGFLGWGLIRAWRQRRAPVPPTEQEQQQGERGLERGLGAWAGLIVFGLTALVLVSFLVDRRMGEAGPNPLRVHITANQWWWRIDYQNGAPSDHVTTANELHLPLGRPALIELDSNDVIHSFWVPNLSGKEDLIPGRTNQLVITPRRPGVYRGQCAEFCGLEHAKMAFKVLVDSPQDFETWRRAQLTSAPTPSAAQPQAGQAVFFENGCALCHRIDGTEAGATSGPDLTHLASRTTLAAGMLPNTSEALSDWIKDPQAVKSGAMMPKVPLTPQQRADLVVYLETLR
ncbi:MAG: hypothetical protein JWM33_3938 [Caulobacteraceae bacterium]|nr:hypothetical protein [Caulobacteraceae bacterium]